MALKGALRLGAHPDDIEVVEAWQFGIHNDVADLHHAAGCQGSLARHARST
jgi:hypothetical protein